MSFYFLPSIKQYLWFFLNYFLQSHLIPKKDFYLNRKINELEYNICFKLKKKNKYYIFIDFCKI